MYQYSETKFQETLNVISLDVISLLQKSNMEIIYMMKDFRTSVEGAASRGVMS